MGLGSWSLGSPPPPPSKGKCNSLITFGDFLQKQAF